MRTKFVWTWPRIACALMWRLAPQGCKVTRKDLGSLPMDRVLVDDRKASEIRFSWLPTEGMKPRVDAGAATGRPEDRVGVSELQGRWMKLATVLLWKLARDGLTLSPRDFEAVPAHLQLLAEGHADCIEYRFLPHAQAAAIARREADNEGKIIVESGR